VPVPWGRRDAHPLFVDWAQRRAVRGEGRRAVVVGCGLGADAEYTALLGFDTTGFDVSATAIRLAGQRFPHTMVHYQVADLLALPAAWRHAFGLVVEIITVQALPDPPRRQAIENIAGLVATEGTLLVLAAVYDPDVPESPVPPWPLRQNEIDAFVTDGLMPVRVELLLLARPTRREGLAGRVPSASSQHPMTPAVGDTAAVFDAVDTDCDRLLDRGSAVRMGGDGQTRRVRAIHNELQLGGRELGAHHVAAGSVDASRGHHLDDVHASLHPLGDRPDNPGGPRDFPTQEVTVPSWTG
jgi:SAM-dependent methyltransferase